MIDQATIDRIKGTARIEEVVSEFVELKKQGANLIGLCPFHNEKTGSFTVTPSKGIFYCFGCNKGGDSVRFIMEHEGLKYPEALRYLAKKYHIEIVEREPTDEEKQAQLERESLYAINDFAAKFFTDALQTPQGKAIGLSYFRERGFTDEIIEKFRLGYAFKDWSKLADAAKNAGYNLELFEKAYLCKKNDKNESYHDFFRDRVIFPWITVSGQVVAFSGRLLSRETKGFKFKYLNTGKTPIYTKKDQLFGIFQANKEIVNQNNVIIVEGQTDVISMHQCGITNVVACSGGMGLSEVQAKLLHARAQTITLMYDCDEAGEKDTKGAIDVALAEGMDVKVVRLPKGEDPDSFARTHNASDFIDFIEKNQTDFLRYKVNLFHEKYPNNDPYKRASLVNDDILKSIAVIPDTFVRQMYIQDCSKLVGVDEQELLNAVNEKRQKKLAKNTKIEAPVIQGPSIPIKKPSTAPETLLNTRVDNEICNILQVLIRYGERPLFVGEDNQLISVGNYIIEELERDNIIFDNQLYNNVLSEYKAHQTDNNFVAENFFRFHENSDICRLSINLLVEKYSISRIHFKQSISENVQKTVKIPTDADRLEKLVPRLILELKSTLLKKRINEVLQEQKLALEQGDEERKRALMSTYSKLKDISILLHKNLERVL